LQDGQVQDVHIVLPAPPKHPARNIVQAITRTLKNLFTATLLRYNQNSQPSPIFARDSLARLKQSLILKVLRSAY
jgi:hypothetical protein